MSKFGILKLKIKFYETKTAKILRIFEHFKILYSDQK